jgi:predicted phosphodiesterase
MTVAPTLPFTSPSPVEVFAVDDRSAQIVWRDLGRGTVIARVDDRIVALGDAHGTGAATVSELMPDREHTITVSVDDRPVETVRVRTAACLGSEPATKIATIGDLHLGEVGFGLVKRMNEPRATPVSYPFRCAEATVDEAIAWGAELIVLKGDITDEGRADEWAEFDRLLDRISVPVMAIPGNHDVTGRRHSLDATDQLRQRGMFPSQVQTVDYATTRIIVVDSTVPRRSYGRLGPLVSELEAAVSVDRPVVIFTHHHLQTTALPCFWPVGMTRRDGYGTLDRLLDINPHIFMSSGHTHRNRVRRHRSAVVTEVGSAKDYPGVWAGYELTDLGVRQTSRRISRPDCIEWTERTRSIVGGMWGRWSPGGLEDRCVTHVWNAAHAGSTVERSYQPALDSPIW